MMAAYARCCEGCEGEAQESGRQQTTALEGLTPLFAAVQIESVMPPYIVSNVIAPTRMKVMYVGLRFAKT